MSVAGRWPALRARHGLARSLPTPGPRAGCRARLCLADPAKAPPAVAGTAATAGIPLLRLVSRHPFPGFQGTNARKSRPKVPDSRRAPTALTANRIPCSHQHRRSGMNRRSGPVAPRMTRHEPGLRGCRGLCSWRDSPGCRAGGTGPEGQCLGECGAGVVRQGARVIAEAFGGLEAGQRDLAGEDGGCFIRGVPAGRPGAGPAWSQRLPRLILRSRAGWARWPPPAADPSAEPRAPNATPAWPYSGYGS